MELFKIALIVCTAFTFVYFSIPTLIRIAESGNFTDSPDQDRKKHTRQVPLLGGIAIFSGFLFACILFLKITTLADSNFLLAASLILFVLGIRDDLIGLSAIKKILAQLIAAAIVVILADVRMSSFYGLFGIFDIPYFVSIPFSIFTILVITNAFNLIDGIDGLAAGMGIFVCLFFGTTFFLMQEQGWSRISFALTGAIAGFLFFNWSPAKIFMGDTGAYVIGFIIAVLSIQFIELNKFDGLNIPFIRSVPAVCISVLYYPLLDTLRAFVIRASLKHSPMYADRNHIHYALADKNWSHKQITSFILITNSIIALAFLLLAQNGIGSTELLIALFVLSGLINWRLFVYHKKL